MDLKEFFKLWGKVSLVEMHKSKEEITYYAKLEYYVRHTNYGTQGDYISDKDALLVPLKEEEYNYLKDKLHNAPTSDFYFLWNQLFLFRAHVLFFLNWKLNLYKAFRY